MRHRAVAVAVFLAVVLVPLRARADDPAFVRERESFLDRRRGMMIGLGTWSVLSLAAGAAALVSAHDGSGKRPVDPFRPLPDPPNGSFRRSFALVTLTYAIINAGIAASTLATLGAQRRSLATGHLVETGRQLSERLFVANAGLDMLYVAVGAALFSRGPTQAARGAGAGFLTQGGFLLAFDTMGSVLYR